MRLAIWGLCNPKEHVILSRWPISMFPHFLCSLIQFLIDTWKENLERPRKRDIKSFYVSHSFTLDILSSGIREFEKNFSISCTVCYNNVVSPGDILQISHLFDLWSPFLISRAFPLLSHMTVNILMEAHGEWALDHHNGKGKF